MDAAVRSRAVLRPRGQRGASLIEYVLLLALVAIVTLSAVSFFGNSNKAGFARSGDCLSAAYNNQPKPANCP